MGWANGTLPAPATGLPVASSAKAKEARAGLQARAEHAEHAEAELQRARADRDKAAGQATPGQPGDATRKPA